MPTWQGVGVRFSLGCAGLSVRMGEAGAAPGVRERWVSASPAPCRCLLPCHLSCRLHQVGDRPAPGGLHGGRWLFGGQEQVCPWPQHGAGETLGMLPSWLPAGGAGCLAGHALPLPTQAACLSLQEEEEEDIDNLVEIHRQRVARGSMRSGTSLVSPRGMAVPCSAGRNDGEGHGWLVGWEGGRAGSSWGAGARAWGMGASPLEGNQNVETQLSSREPACGWEALGSHPQPRRGERGAVRRRRGEA